MSVHCPIRNFNVQFLYNRDHVVGVNNGDDYGDHGLSIPSFVKTFCEGRNDDFLGNNHKIGCFSNSRR